MDSKISENVKVISIATDATTNGIKYSYNSDMPFTSLYCDMWGRCAHIYHKSDVSSIVNMISGQFERYEASASNALYLRVSTICRCVIIIGSLYVNSIDITTYRS